MFNSEHSTGNVLILTAPSLINESQSLAIFCLAEAALLRYNCPVQKKGFQIPVVVAQLNMLWKGQKT